MAHWCEHADCLESTADFPTQAALDQHMRSEHDQWLTTPAEPEPEPDSEAGAAAGRAAVKPRLVIAPGNGCSSIEDANWCTPPQPPSCRPLALPPH